MPSIHTVNYNQHQTPKPDNKITKQKQPLDIIDLIEKLQN